LYCSEKTKIKEKEAGDGPFKKDGFVFKVIKQDPRAFAYAPNLSRDLPRGLPTGSSRKLSLRFSPKPKNPKNPSDEESPDKAETDQSISGLYYKNYDVIITTTFRA